MRDIFYNTKYKIGSDEWINSLNEGELAEWNWIDNNIQKIAKHTEDFELSHGWYIGRLLYALSFQRGSDKDVDYSKADYTAGYAKYEDTLEELPNLKLQGEFFERLQFYYKLSMSKGMMQDLDTDLKQVNSLIQQCQEQIDKLEVSIEDIREERPNRYDYRTAIYRRAEHLFVQMKEEGKQANISIQNIYQLYYTHKIDGYYETDSDWGYDHPIFKRIQEQRLQALKHFKHRFSQT